MKDAVADCVVGSGAAALAAALFAARHGPVRLHERRAAQVASCVNDHGVENVPAATLTLLLELGITPDEVGVNQLEQHRLVAWESPHPECRTGSASAHVDTGALVDALNRRVGEHPRITRCFSAIQPCAAGTFDATGRRSVAIRLPRQPPRTWAAATVTVPATADRTMHLAASPDGYAYRLGSADKITVGWVAPEPPPRTAAALDARITSAGAGWLLEGLSPQPDIATRRRPASAALPRLSTRATPIGDAALTRDALAAQGLSIALSDACLATDPAIDAAWWAQRQADAVHRHLRNLQSTVESCHHAAAPAWHQYRQWIQAERAATTIDEAATRNSMKAFA